MGWVGEDRCPGDGRRASQTSRFLAGLDRGELVDGRVVQLLEPDGVRVVLGPGVVWARAVGGKPGLGWRRFQVVVPGDRPVLRLIEPHSAGRTDLLVDVSREKGRLEMGRRVDHRA